MQIITLTDYRDDSLKVLIRPSEFVGAKEEFVRLVPPMKSEKYTVVTVRGNDYLVKESAEEIAKMLECLK